MFLSAMIFPLLVSLSMAEEPPITVKGFPWAPFISPMGEPFRGRATAESPIARWFEQADRNRDSVLTADEMQFDAERFFARLDGNGDGQIDPEELVTYEWEIAPEIQVNSKWRRPRGHAATQSAPESERIEEQGFGNSRRKSKEDEHDGYQIDGLQGAARYGLLNIPQPVASADADFNRVITLVEFRHAASHRFNLLDSRRQGRISLTELEARLPIRPEGRRVKRPKDAGDKRIGLPLPKGN